MLKILQRFVKVIIEALCVELTSPHVVVNGGSSTGTGET